MEEQNATSPPPQRPPTVGRIVHYTPRTDEALVLGPGPCAAIVTEVHTPTCINVMLLHPSGAGHHGRTSLSLANEPSPGQWHWPPRV